MNVRLLLFRHWLIPLFTIILLTSLRYAPASPSKSHLADISAKRVHFTQLIDSLDLVKQDLKRSGNPVAEIELQQNQLRDSLEVIRKIINRTTAIKTASQKKSDDKKGTFIQTPHNFFDWIIIIVGIIATFSGILLITGISRSVLGAANRKKQPPAPHATSTEQTPHRESAYPMYTLHDVTPASRPKPAKDSSTSASSRDLSALQALKKRMDTPPPPHVQQPSEPVTVDLIQPPPTMEEPDPTPPAPVATAAIRETPDTKASIEEKVIRAARNGMDAATISKKFHLSSDHVALLLKIAKSKPDR